MARQFPPRIDRDLSWLSFNERVLLEAEDESVPLVDRLRFVAIYSSNLDEFFRVRVAGLRNLARLERKHRRKLDIPPRHLLSSIHQTVITQQERLGLLIRDRLLPALEVRGIRLVQNELVPNEPDQAVTTWFETHVLPRLAPIVVEPQEKGPWLENGRIYLVAAPPSGREPLMAETAVRLGIVEVPVQDVGRFVQSSLNGSIRDVRFLEDLIRCHLDQVFPDLGPAYAWAVKVTRDAELDLEDEFPEDLAAVVRRGLKSRELGPATRFLYDQAMPWRVMDRLIRALDLDALDLVAGGRYHNLKDFWNFPIDGLEDDVSPAHVPARNRDLDEGNSIFDAIASADRLLSFPYESFDPVIRFFQEAASDPAVTRLWASLYRVAPGSRIVSALVEAAERGKKVVAVVEALARFDEEHNLDWAERLAAAGAHVVYGVPGRKVHSKLALVERIVDGVTRHFAWLGTGNFNEATARVYADHGLFTADPEMTRDVRRMFLMLQGHLVEPRMKHLLVAPLTLRKKLNRLIEAEASNARAGLPSGIVLKVNSLEDRRLIARLVKAAEAGVPVRLIVRGIHCVGGVVPGIQAVSIVDRFLEHARVLVFANAGEPAVYLSSADWMERSMDRRVEIAFPVTDRSLAQRLQEILAVQLADSMKSRILGGSGENSRTGNPGEEGVRSQLEIARLLSRDPGTQSPFESLFGVKPAE